MPRPKLAALLAVALLSGSCTEDVGLVPPDAERPAPGGAHVPAAEAAPRRAAFGDYVVSGPYAHENLAVYLVHGADKIKGKSFLTLEEALAKKLAVLHETGNVSKLAIENVSLTDEIYVQSGDIVKGGKQDRVIAHDFIVPAKSGKMPIASFCVERGRWSKRGKESATQFLVSDGQLSTKALKMAAKKSGSQQEVWREVANAQARLAANVGGATRRDTRHTSAVSQAGAAREAQQVIVNVQLQELTDADTAQIGLNSMNQPGQRSVLGYVSPTSLQLTLESKKVKEAAEKYTKALAGVVEGRDDVVGFAFAINGEANSADLYASRALFRKLWPKLLKAAAVEAVAELKKDEENKKVAHPAAGYLVAEFFTKLDEEGEKVAVSEKEITKRVRMKTKESDEVILFEMFDTAKPAAEARLHINVITK
ncbi:MAG: ARPP-1 family domain-containing protein [Planctomycetota bacterium]|jgi:hypothetical protein